MHNMNLSKYIAKQFGNPTGIGGRIITFIMNNQNQEQYMAVIQALNLNVHETVLDIGFGNGHLIKKLAKKVQASFWGIDISEDMLQVSCNNNQQMIKQGRMHLQVGDVSKMDYEDDFFDKAYTVNTIYFWSDINVGLAEVNRVMKTGGIFVNAFYSKEFLNRLKHTDYEYNKYTKAEWETLVVQNGFKIKDIVMTKENMAYCYTLQKV